MSSFPTTLQDKAIIYSAELRLADEGFTAERTDNQLVELVLAGDETAFEGLFERHKRLVAVVASRYFREPEQIEEIIQISFAKAFVELRKFRGDYDLSLAGITRNASLDLLRMQKRRPESLICESFEIADLANAESSGKSVEDHLIERDLAEKLLSSLPPEDRALLQILMAEDLSMAESAVQMGWSVSKTKIRAWRARKSLRRVLKRFV